MSNLTSAIDQLGIVKAQIAELQLRESDLKAVLILQGAGPHEGEMYRATVSISTRETLDMAACRKKLSAQFIAAHTKVTDVTTIRVVARTGVGLSVERTARAKLTRVSSENETV